jgi:hypothetical protein
MPADGAVAALAPPVVPSPPIEVVAVAGNGHVAVSFQPPVFNGGARSGGDAVSSDWKPRKPRADWRRFSDRGRRSDQWNCVHIPGRSAECSGVGTSGRH